MTSPVVWQDAFDRATAAAVPLGLKVKDILAQDLDPGTDPWVYFETASAASGRLGVGEIINEETGQIWLHLMVQRGTGAIDAVQKRKILSVAFRVPVEYLPKGLYYDDQGFDPPAQGETGNWIRFSLMVDYRYQDIVLPAS
ncbi:hypothetical protein A0U94_06585 [Gluconobacter albidus]|uniref:hypothetical protein n=1 Tax=Gluconobacter albidus TaxID=318683 RepID=UPI00098B4A6F|nr:hypothetical protein [Gluconobacter albidus]AQS90689.1 hypothetical protein A0U94_06585 [Gluconobacter albidus]